MTNSFCGLAMIANQLQDENCQANTSILLIIDIFGKIIFDLAATYIQQQVIFFVKSMLQTNQYFPCQVCAGGEFKEGSCKGDSGGGLYFQVKNN